jgi:hypothetical protein
MVPFFFIMTYITATASQTELSAINRMLASVGVAPVTSIETESINRADGSTETVQTNPDVAIAVNTLTEVSREVQSEGWVFNKEYNVKVTPNNNNELVISELETTLGNIIIQIDLPVSVQDYIVAKAAALYSQRVVGDANQYQILQQKAAECRIYALNYDCEQGDYTFFGHPAGQNYYNSYQPFHTLQR